MKKCLRIAELLRTRIKLGDYSIKRFPAERQLAAETGVSYMTARKAVKELIEDGWIVRRTNGRLEVRRNGEGPPKKIALLVPTLNSPHIESWRIAIDQAVRRRGWFIRPVLYVHWNDPIIPDVLNGFEATFLVTVSGEIPSRVLAQLQSASRLIVVDDDWSARGCVSIQSFPSVFVQRLLDHFAALGHSRIGCLNTQPHDAVILGRIGQWRVWLSAHGLTGTVWDHPVSAYTAPFQAAYETVSKAVESGSFDVTALLCTTAPAAIGAMRALSDHGIRPGRDVAIGAVNGESYAQFLNPSLTALEPPDPTPFLAACLDWVEDSERSWKGPLLLQPSDVPLIVRETSCHVQTLIGREPRMN
jgi:DNA-binding LacI/PurR family transcriptional regulator